MKNITEKKLIELGFKREDVTQEESGDKPFHYFTYEIGELCLISNSNDESIDGNYSVEFFDYCDAVCFTDIEMLADLIKILESNKI